VADTSTLLELPLLEVVAVVLVEVLVEVGQYRSSGGIRHLCKAGQSLHKPSITTALPAACLVSALVLAAV